MPQPRKPSPRRRERRSRSRSYSPRQKRRSRSRSRDRRKSKSRSPHRRSTHERRRSPRKKSLSPRRRSTSPKLRSHSPKRRSRSHSPRRRESPPRRRSRTPKRSSPHSRRSPSPGDRNYPVKRPADSSMKRQSYRSRSPSPAPVKKSRDDRPFRDDSPYKQQRSRHSPSPVHESRYGGKMYADQPSSSKKPLFPAAGSSKRGAEIDFVTIIEKGPRREKLNKRFETSEQAALRAFDFEENITIGIHRGPSHIDLDDDEDYEVNYNFNPKTFKMMFPKKEYIKAIFDRDEIKIFRHDDILDEEAYVEKRTISIKPVNKPKSRKYDDELDYKITVGSDREGYGDRRMVHDSGSRQKSSRSSGYSDVPVTVRLDPKPDPRYEKMYREQQRYEDQSARGPDKVSRDPHDLRYNLMRRRSDGDRGERFRDDRDAPSSAMDARSRIEARRQVGPDDRGRPDRHLSPPRTERRKATVKSDLPDFKNRPEDYGVSPHDDPIEGRFAKWGHCSICNVPLNSEKQAFEHVNGERHIANEEAKQQRIAASKQGRDAPEHFTSGRYRETSGSFGESGRDGLGRIRMDDAVSRKRHLSSDSDFGQRQVKRRSVSDDFKSGFDDDYDDFADRYPVSDVRYRHGDENSPDHDHIEASKDKLKPEPEWKINPTITPKGQSYYEHDNRNRDDMTFWERKQMFLKTGRYPARGMRRGRGMVLRGRGRGRGFDQGRSFDQGFFRRPIGGAKDDDWKHDKFDEVADEDSDESKDSKDKKDLKSSEKTDRKDRKEHKDKNKQKDSKSTKSDSNSKWENLLAKEQENIDKEEESLKQELKVEVTIG